MAVDTKKLMTNKSSLKGEDSTIVIEEKLITIKKLLGERVNIKRKEVKRETRQNAIEKRQQKEQKLESSTPKFNIKKFTNLAQRLPGGGILDWFKNFIVLTFAGWFIKNIRSFLPALEFFFNKTLPAIGRMMDGFINFLNGPVIDFIGGAYKLYDNIGTSIEKHLGVKWREKFDEFSSLFNKIITGALVLGTLNVLSGGLFGLGKKKPPIPPPKPPGMGGGGKANYYPGGPGGLSSGQLSRLNDSHSRFISGKWNLGDRLRLLRRGWITPRQFFSKGAFPEMPNARASRLSPSSSISPPSSSGKWSWINNLLKGSKERLFKIGIPKWVVNVFGKWGFPILKAIFAWLDFKGRREANQSVEKAASGTLAGLGGGTLGATLTAMVLFPEPTTSIVGAIGLAIASMIGYGVGASLGGAASDTIWDKIEENEKNGQAFVESSKFIPLDVGILNTYADYEGLLEVRYNYIQPILRDD